MRTTTGSPRPLSLSRTALVVAALVAFGLVATTLGEPARAATTAGARTRGPARTVVAAATRPNPTNPLAGRAWGVYKGPAEQSWAPYQAARGAQRTLLGKIALRPKAKWFGAWISNAKIAGKVHDYIAGASGGDPQTLVQMTVFRMVPWEHDACRRLPTRAEQAGYRQWVDRFAAAVGSQHAAIVLQPDGPFALCVPHHSALPSHLIAYSAKVFSALPHTAVYLDGGTADWPARQPAVAARLLVAAGVRFTRGFALNSTHYTRVEDDLAFGRQVVTELGKHGLHGKHFVINTSSNGQGFAFDRARGGGSPDNAKVCQTKAERVCVTLGIPPTYDVADSRWGLTRAQRAVARTYVDGYLWFGRPWLYMQADPFVKARALALARTTPW